MVDLVRLDAAAERLANGGRTVVHVARAGRVEGLIAIADAPRPTSAAAVAALKQRGVQVAMLTGDNRATAERIGQELGVSMVLAEVLPGQKAEQVKGLQAQGKKVGMVGRRHQRCPRPYAGRCRFRYRCGHRRGDGERRRGAHEERPVRCGGRHWALASDAAQDASEPVVGSRL